VPGAQNGQVSAIILAAGVGRRLGEAAALPKVLLDIGGRTLLQRHLAILAAEGIEDIAITVGHRSDAIRAEVARAGFEDRVQFVENGRYREGSLVSLWAQRDRLRARRPVILMDGDVLYDRRMMARLQEAPGEAVLLVDREIEPGDEPVKVCFRGEEIVDFRKRPERLHDWHGESVGFFRFSPRIAAALAERCDHHVGAGNTALEYEEAIRDLILAEPSAFRPCDISDLPWTEIDFPEDVARARGTILQRLVA
jgi:choline kinase